MWELTLNIIKSGFPLLWVILGAMIISSIWNRKDDPQAHKVKWTVVVIAPIFLAFLFWLIFRNQTELVPIFGAIIGLLVLILPFVGVGIWLFKAYR